MVSHEFSIYAAERDARAPNDTALQLLRPTARCGKSYFASILLRDVTERRKRGLAVRCVTGKSIRTVFGQRKTVCVAFLWKLGFNIRITDNLEPNGFMCMLNNSHIPLKTVV